MLMEVEGRVGHSARAVCLWALNFLFVGADRRTSSSDAWSRVDSRDEVFLRLRLSCAQTMDGLRFA